MVSDRLLVDVQYAHVGNNFILDFHEDDLATVQPTLIVSTSLNLRSASQSVIIRPVNSFNFNANYFLPGKLVGDHAFKLGGYWRDAQSTTISHTGGNATARFPTQASYDTDTAPLASPPGCAVSLTRDGYTAYDLANISVYAQDTLSTSASRSSSACATTATTIRCWPADDCRQPDAAGPAPGGQLRRRRSRRSSSTTSRRASA